MTTNNLYTLQKGYATTHPLVTDQPQDALAGGLVGLAKLLQQTSESTLTSLVERIGTDGLIIGGLTIASVIALRYFTSQTTNQRS